MRFDKSQHSVSVLLRTGKKQEVVDASHIKLQKAGTLPSVKAFVVKTYDDDATFGYVEEGKANAGALKAKATWSVIVPIEGKTSLVVPLKSSDKDALALESLGLKSYVDVDASVSAAIAAEIARRQKEMDDEEEARQKAALLHKSTTTEAILKGGDFATLMNLPCFNECFLALRQSNSVVLDDAMVIKPVKPNK